jgi:hypothetical protein
MGAMFLIVIRHSDVARNQEINQKLYRNLAHRLIDEQILGERDSADPTAVQRVFDRIRVVNPRIDVYLLDTTGKVVAASVQDGLKRDRVDLEPIRRLSDENAKLPILGDDPSDDDGRRVFSVAHVRLGADSAGYMYLVLRGFSGDTLVQRIKQSYVLRETLLLIAVRSRDRAARERGHHHAHDAAAAAALGRDGQVPEDRLRGTPRRVTAPAAR